MGTLLNRRRYMGGMSLPYEAEVEYLESTGTQWINTGINCNSNYILEVEAQGAQGAEGVMGARVSSSSNMHTFVFPGNAAQARYSYGGQSLFVSVNLTSFNYYRAEKEKYYVNGDLAGTLSAASFTLNFPYYLFALDTNGSVSNLGAKKIKMCRIWDGASLLLDLIPVRKGQVGYMYDKVSRQLLGNQGTGDFILGPDKAPEFYDAEIEYLESTGTAYIDTGIIPTLSYSVEMEFKWVSPFSNNDASGMLFGTLNGWNENTFMFLCTYQLDKKNLFNCWGNENTGNDNASYIGGLLDNWHSLTFRNKLTYIDGTAISAAANGTGDPVSNLLLFVAKNHATGNFFGVGTIKQIRKFTLYDGNMNAVRDYVLVRVGQTGYMYDRVSGQLFGNAGTGDFILGNDKT